MVFTEIISIGDELLIGQVVNTNASWMAAELNKNGINVVQITAISDRKEHIWKALDEALERGQIVILTGGLGPTKDDITKPALASYFDSKMVFHQPTYEHIKKLFAERNYPVTDVNRLQAEIPEKCIPLANPHGTAPGMWFEKEGKIVVSLPGVPFEMKSLITDEVIPRLKQKLALGTIYHKTTMTHGMGESALAELISDWESALPETIKLAYLPQPGIVRLRLSVSGDQDSKLKEAVDEQCRQLGTIIPDLIFGYDDLTMEEVVGNYLKKSYKTLSAAESCTGGYLSHLITSIPGSSAYFKGSVISYSNEAKIELLGVPEQNIIKYGAVSQEVVEAMALGALNRFSSDYALAISGIAGPDGGTPDKPVGTVWIALASSDGITSRLFHYGEHRGRNIRRSALSALNMLRLELKLRQTGE
ncbi:MAG: competence/damage-inducible protein A [Bacteroidetes bacterium HGW-Bacteroidetes-16]|jgi:nicotinamide-nucleotide amidase|nr:MAG: competence/damage-inducible protein A [Bacteroidetes bacterium HGW-Bacteroidetes-16]